MPNQIALIEVDVGAELTQTCTIDSHAMDGPATVFASLRGLGGTVPPTVVGSAPADTGEHIGLSPAVEAAVERHAQGRPVEAVTVHVGAAASRARCLRAGVRTGGRRRRPTEPAER